MVLQKRAIRTRQAILEAAGAVFAEVGYEASTIAQILQRASVTKGALYFHFSSKEELAQAVLADQLSSVPPIPPRDLVLQDGLDATFLLAHLLSIHEPLVEGSIRLTVDPGAPDDGLDRRVPMATWIDFNAKVLARAKENGEVLPHVDVDASAKVFVAAFTGAQVLSKIMSGHADLMERVVDIERHLMTSIAVPAVLLQLDMSLDRGARVYEEVTALRRHGQETDTAD